MHEHDFKVTFELQNFLNVGPMGCVYLHYGFTWKSIDRGIEKCDSETSEIGDQLKLSRNTGACGRYRMSLVLQADMMSL